MLSFVTKRDPGCIAKCKMYIDRFAPIRVQFSKYAFLISIYFAYSKCMSIALPAICKREKDRDREREMGCCENCFSKIAQNEFSNRLQSTFRTFGVRQPWFWHIRHSALSKIPRLDVCFGRLTGDSALWSEHKPKPVEWGTYGLFFIVERSWTRKLRALASNVH